MTKQVMYMNSKGTQYTAEGLLEFNRPYLNDSDMDEHLAYIKNHIVPGEIFEFGGRIKVIVPLEPAKKMMKVSAVPAELTRQIIINEAEILQMISNRVVANGDDPADLKTITYYPDRTVMQVCLGDLFLGTISTEINLERGTVTTSFQNVNL